MPARNTLLVISYLVLCSVMQAQHFTSGANSIDTVEYVSKNMKVPVYVFNAPASNPNIKGNLTAHAPADTSDFTFDWSKYNPVSNDFDDLLPSLTGPSSLKNNLDEGGYRVVVSHPTGYVDTIDAWIFINDFSLEIRKDSEGKVIETKIFCDVVYLETNAHFDTLVYYDVFDGSQYFLVSSANVIYWTAETDDSEFTTKMTKLNPSVSNPPVEDATFHIEVTDKYGATASDQVDYVPLAVRAKFELDELLVTEKTPLDFYSKYYTDNPSTLSAPQDVFCTNKSSSKATDYIWKFGDDSISVKRDSVFHTYLFPGEYVIKLIASNQFCTDSTEEDEIKVLDITSEPELVAPNYLYIQENRYSTGADEYVWNIFRVYDLSVTNFEIFIFSRYGQKVHHFEGNDIRQWHGWDGRINNSDRRVKTGVYFYVIKTALAYNTAKKEVKFDKKTLTGFIYVFNPDGL